MFLVPAFDESGTLPQGIHTCTWQEVVAAFGWNFRRQWLLIGLIAAARALQSAGCSTLYLDGSFVTRKDEPSDYDGCWDAAGVDVQKLDPVLLDFGPGRLAQKVKYRGELFVAHFIAERGTGKHYMEFFQRDKDGNAKGLIAIDLRSLP